MSFVCLHSSVLPSDFIVLIVVFFPTEIYLISGAIRSTLLLSGSPR